MNDAGGPFPPPNNFEPFRGEGDPYRPALGWHLLLAVIALVGLGAVVVMQRPEAMPQSQKELAAAGLEKHPGPSIEASILAKIHFATGGLYSRMLQESIDGSAGFETASAGDLPFQPKRKEGDPLPPANDRLHAAVLAGETLGPEEALKRLEEVVPQIDAKSPLIEDAEVLRRIYEGEAPADVEAGMGPEEHKGFVSRHGLFGRLALSYGDPKAEARLKAGHSGMIILVAIGCFAGGALMAGLAGMGMLVYFLIQLAHGQLRARFAGPRSSVRIDEGPTAWGWSMDPQGRLVWLEAFVVFVVGFLLLKLSGDALHSSFGPQPWLAYYALIGQWLLLLTVFWPVVRGMPMARWRGEIGWHRGEGFFREVGAGLMAYLATLPLYFLMALVVAVLIMLFKLLWDWDLAPQPEENKLIDLATGGSPLVLALVFLLATVWAPIVEESVFRGSLYRYLRGWSVPAGAVAVTAAAFAVMHGYAAIQLLMVGLLGLVFALMREWRGSLIPSMTAHFVHNAIVMTFMLVLFGQLD